MSGEVSLTEILTVLFLGSLVSFGGGNGLLAVVQNYWVSRGHLDAGLFTWVIALSHLTPGPKAGFLAGIGYYLHGVAGAATAVVGATIPTCLASAAVSRGLDRLRPAVARVALPGPFVIAGLILAAAWDTALPLGLSAWEALAAAFIAWLVGWRGADPLAIVLGGAAAGLLWQSAGRLF